MKRTEIKRKTPLARSSEPLGASKGLGQGKGLKRGKRAQKASISVGTRLIVVDRQVVVPLKCECGCGRPVELRNPAAWHHIFPKHLWPVLIDVPSNLILCAVDCHSNHEVASRRFKRLVVWRAESLVTSPQMASYLDRTYGPR